VGGVVLVGIGVLVDSGASAVQAAKVLATAVSMAPGWGVEGVGAQAARRNAAIKRITNFFICLPFLRPLGRTRKIFSNPTYNIQGFWPIAGGNFEGILGSGDYACMM
jgi:hypothetical protein